MNNVYYGKIKILQNKKNMIDKLLSIEDLENSDIGYRKDFENIVSYTFKNKTILYIDLCSGDNNYFLQYQLFDKDSNLIEEDFMFDLEELNEVEDFENGNKYIIDFEFGGINE